MADLADQRDQLLDAFLAAFAERNVEPTRLNILSAVTDSGGSSELAQHLADLLERRQARRTRPWHRLGMSRGEWFRKRGTGSVAP